MLELLKKFFSTKNHDTEKEDQSVKYLIAGLGNIGPDYENTRHNIGFMVLDHLARKHNCIFEPARYGDKALFKHKGRVFILIKPSTYMNLSGKAINYWLNKEKIHQDKLLVIVDDIALPLGTLRLKAKGSDGGHNGLANIINVMGSNNFPRLRFGIGNEYSKGRQVDFVLGKWEPEETKIIKPKIEECSDLIISFATIGIERTMNYFNKKPKQNKSNN
ncbi:MAG: aminoacyl-tRNA hydrolase [Bacteroidota bacterium]